MTPYLFVSTSEHPTSSALWDDLEFCGHIFKVQQSKFACLVSSPVAPIALDIMVPCEKM